ncbi:MAG: hypothetical protein AAF554_02320 [Bacteroidota bacterium]
MVVLILLLVSCEGQDDTGKRTNPTSFSGRVIFQDTQEPFVGGEIGITGFKGNFPIADIISSQFQDIGDDGRFQILFEGDESIDSFVITIFDVSNGTPEPTFSDFNCGSSDCNDIKPGREYSDITIELLR